MARLWLTWVAAGILTASPAWADDVRRPRVEIGGTLSAAFPFPLEDSVGVLVGGGPSVTVNLTRRLAVELRAETFGPVEESGIFGLYLTQVKIPIRQSSSGARPLVLTVGAAGAASYQHLSETRRPRVDGSTIVHPEFRRFIVTKPTTLNRSAGERMGVARTRFGAVSHGRPHASPSLSMATGSQSVTRGSSHGVGRSAFPDDGPASAVLPRTGLGCATLEPRADWTDIMFVPSQFTPPIDVSYCYINSFGASRGVLEIDRIELVQ